MAASSNTFRQLLYHIGCEFVHSYTFIIDRIQVQSFIIWLNLYRFGLHIIWANGISKNRRRICNVVRFSSVFPLTFLALNLCVILYCFTRRKLEFVSKQNSAKDELLERKRRLVDFGIYLSRHSNGWDLYWKYYCINVWRNYVHFPDVNLTCFFRIVSCQKRENGYYKFISVSIIYTIGFGTAMLHYIIMQMLTVIEGKLFQVTKYCTKRAKAVSTTF